MIPVQGYYVNRESGVGYYFGQQLAEEQLGLKKSIATKQEEIDALKQEIKILRRDLELIRDINHEHHARICYEIDALKENKVQPSLINNSHVVQNRKTMAKLEDLDKYMPDLRHLHRQNIDEASDTSLE